VEGTDDPHPIDEMFDPPPDRIERHAIEYTQTSFFVHCTQPSLDGFFPEVVILSKLKHLPVNMSIQEELCLMLCFMCYFGLI
jgi:hypothetical protein